MTRPIVRCRCGHRVLAKEVLRTDLYERPSGREYVYVKYRCKRCKRLGETFVAENRWDWRIFEPTRSEMSEVECDSFAGQAPICAEEVLEFHHQLATIEQASELAQSTSTEATPDVSRPDVKRDVKREPKADHKSEHKSTPSETSTGNADDKRHRDCPPRDGH